MTPPSLAWQRITTRADARCLQAFACTSDLPRTSGGRRLPHPKPWEWEAQAHLRRASTSLAPGELLLVGRQHEELVAAVHLHFDAGPTLLATFIAALAVSRTVRGIGGAVAAESLDAVMQETVVRAQAEGATHALLTGNIHNANGPSRRLVERAGFEPAAAPIGEYQEWSLLLPIGG